MNKPRICVIANDFSQQYPTIDCGGAEVCIEALSKGLYSNDYDFYVICPRREVKHDYPFKIIDTQVLPVKYSQNSNGYYKEAVDFILQNPVDLVLAPAYSPHLDRLNCKVIVTIFGSGDGNIGDIQGKNNVYYRFISISQYQRCMHSKPAYFNRSFFAYTSLTDEHFYAGEDGGYFLWAASLQWNLYNKGGDIFIGLAQKYPQFKFKMFGGGCSKTEQYLKEVEKQLPNLEFGGFLDRNTPKHSETFANARAFCQFSRLTESFGRVSLESICHGAPVIGFHNSTAGIIKNGENGYLVNNDTELDFAINNVQNLDRQRIMTGARLDFHVNREVEKIIDFYNLCC